MYCQKYRFEDIIIAYSIIFDDEMGAVNLITYRL